MEGVVPHQGRSFNGEEGVTTPLGKKWSCHRRGWSRAEEAIREEEETIGEERGHAFPLMCDGCPFE
jgi:hypothetical protein